MTDGWTLNGSPLLEGVSRRLSASAAGLSLSRQRSPRVRTPSPTGSSRASSNPGSPLPDSGRWSPSKPVVTRPNGLGVNKLPSYPSSPSQHHHHQQHQSANGSAYYTQQTHSRKQSAARHDSGPLIPIIIDKNPVSRDWQPKHDDYAAFNVLRRASKTLDAVMSAPPSRKWLYLHFLISLALPISNKSLLLRWFPFPFILATVQMACATLGTAFAAQRNYFRTATLTTRRQYWMHLIALIFSLDILAVTISIRWTTVPYHLSVRALSPVATLIIEILFGKAKSTVRSSSFLLLIVIGIIFTSSHIPLSSPGALVTVFAVTLGTGKSLVTTHLLQNHYRLHPMDILAKTSPIAMGHLALFALFSGEVGQLWRIEGDDFSHAHMIAVLANGFLSFLFAVVGFKAEERNAIPLLSVSTHAASACTIIISLFVYGLSLSPLNFIGVALTLAGGVLFALHDLKDLMLEQRSSRLLTTPIQPQGQQAAMLPTQKLNVQG